MSEARKAGERFRSTELMASTWWFPPFPSGREGVQQAEGAPSAASSPSSAGLPGTLAFGLVALTSFSQSSNLCFFCSFLD